MTFFRGWLPAFDLCASCNSCRCCCRSDTNEKKYKAINRGKTETLIAISEKHRLPKSRVILIDDNIAHNIPHAKDAGFSTITAVPDGSHFRVAEEMARACFDQEGPSSLAFAVDYDDTIKNAAGQFINMERMSEFFSRANDRKMPIHFVTARLDSPQFAPDVIHLMKQYLTAIKSTENPRDFVHFTGMLVEVNAAPSLTLAANTFIKSDASEKKYKHINRGKVAVLEMIRRKYNLSKNQVIFIDHDETKNVTEAKNAGFTTITSIQDGSHFTTAYTRIQSLDKQERVAFVIGYDDTIKNPRTKELLNRGEMLEFFAHAGAKLIPIHIVTARLESEAQIQEVGEIMRDHFLAIESKDNPRDFVHFTGALVEQTVDVLAAPPPTPSPSLALR